MLDTVLGDARNHSYDIYHHDYLIWDGFGYNCFDVWIWTSWDHVSAAYLNHVFQLDQVLQHSTEVAQKNFPL